MNCSQKSWDYGYEVSWGRHTIVFVKKYSGRLLRFKKKERIGTLVFLDESTRRRISVPG